MDSSFELRSIKEDFIRANTYAKKQDTFKALEQFIKTFEAYSQVKNDPQRVQTDYLINDIFINLTSNRQIIEVFKELGTDVPRLKIQKNNYTTTITILNALKIKLDSKELQKIEQIESEKQNKLTTVFSLAEEAAKNNEITIARVNFKRYVNECEDRKQALTEVISCLKSIKYYDLIMEFCEIGMRLFPRDIDFCLNAIDAAVHFQDFDSIIGYYIFYFQYFGTSSETLLHKAKTLQKIGKIPEAITIAKQSLELDPSYMEADSFIKALS